MKIVGATLLSLAVPAAAYTHVRIKLNCKGIKVPKLSVAVKTLFAHALEDTYNDVHGNIDDSTLSNVHWGADGFEDQRLGTYPGWGGDWDCEWCENDDAFMIGSTGATLESSATHKLWESMFVEVVSSKDKASLSGLQSCSIKMTAHGFEGEDEESLVDSDVTTGSSTAVDIALKCKGMNLNKLSVSDVTVVSHVLQDSYNEVHGENEKDDGELTNVHFGPSQRFDEKHLGPYPGWGGDWDCHWCENDDAVLTPDAAAQLVTGPALKEWEEKVAAGLRETGRKSFKKVKRCEIKMTAAAGTTDEDTIAGESTKCGVRACAHE